MRVYFNDLTLTGDDAKDFESLLKFLSSFKSFSEKTGIKRIWAPRAVKERFGQFDWKQHRTHYQLFLGVFPACQQAIDSEEVPIEIQDRYLESRFYIEIESVPKECEMMGWAEMNNSITLGIASQDPWIGLSHTIKEKSALGRIDEKDTICLTLERHLEDEKFRSWYEECFKGEPSYTQLKPHEKKVHFRDDHGKDLLEQKAKQLVNSGYVVEIVNSLPFSHTGRRFDEDAFADGLVHLRLYWTDKGYGMVVKTTGENLVQTRKIASRLAEQYGHR